MAQSVCDLSQSRKRRSKPRLRADGALVGYRSRLGDWPSVHLSWHARGELSGRGIPSIVAESGYPSTYNEPEIGVHTTGVRNVLRAFKLLDGEPELSNQARQKVVTENWVASTTRGGVFHPRFKHGDRVGRAHV